MYRQHFHQSASAERGCKKGAVNSENNQFIGNSRGGKTTKIHAVVDALGNPVHFMLTGGQVHDASAAIDLLSEVQIAGSNILGDKAYGSQAIREYITEQKARYTIPPRENCVAPWSCDFSIYKERHLIECFSINSKSFAELPYATTIFHISVTASGSFALNLSQKY